MTVLVYTITNVADWTGKVILLNICPLTLCHFPSLLCYSSRPVEKWMLATRKEQST